MYHYSLTYTKRINRLHAQSSIIVDFTVICLHVCLVMGLLYPVTFNAALHCIENKKIKTVQYIDNPIYDLM